MSQIICNSLTNIPDNPDDFSEYNELKLIILPDLKFQLRSEVNLELGTQSQYLPYNYRLRFVHPSYYYTQCKFRVDSIKKMNILKTLAKRGVTIVFIVDSEKDSSLMNACSFLARCFDDCRNEGEALTNVPFPVKKEDALPHDWIWSCYWDHNFPEEMNEEQSEAFINTIRFDFPEYDPRFFPVRVINTCEENNGVTAFSVKVGNGQVWVVPPQRECKVTEECEAIEEPPQKIEVQVKEFPARISLKANNKLVVEYDIIYKGECYSRKVSGLSFLRLLTLYYASQGENCFGFILDGGELENIFIVKPNSKTEEITWKCLFNTPDNGRDGSFCKTQNKIIKLVLLDEYKDEVHKLVVDRLPGGHRKQQRGLLIEKLNNLTIKFADEPLRDFMNFTLTCSGSRKDEFSEVLPSFKNAIEPLVKP